MVSFKKVDHFMYKDIFQAVHRLLHKLQIEPDPAGVGVARSPPGLHPPDSPIRNANS